MAALFSDSQSRPHKFTFRAGEVREAGIISRYVVEETNRQNRTVSRVQTLLSNYF